MHAIPVMTGTTSTSEEVGTAGRGRDRNGPPSCWDRRVPERRPPWSYPIFCWPADPSSPRRPSPTSWMRPRPQRVRRGWAFLFDPSGEIECPAHVERVGWSPLTTAVNWDAAVQTSDAMVAASRSGGVGIARSPGDQHWTERASALLSPLLHAAAIESLPMRTVVRWIDRHDGATPLQILSRTVGDDATATDLLSGIVGTDAAGAIRHMVHRVRRPGRL